jgi:outer membrane cobalamin receptor
MILLKLFKINFFFFLFSLLTIQTSMADEAINQSLSEEVNFLAIDEIIVTAEKRTESLQDVSKAVSVFDADELETKKYYRLCRLKCHCTWSNCCKK